MKFSLIRPFRALRPLAANAGDVAAPPYDVLSTEEARLRATGKPWSFLHISKPEIDLPPGTDPYAPVVYETGARNLDRLMEDRVLARDSRAGYYVYRLVMGSQVQLGLGCVASVAAYDVNLIRKHEFTRPDKEDDRVRQIEALNAQTGPVLLAYPFAPGVDAILTQASVGGPDLDVTAQDGVRHSIWVLDDDTRVAELTAAFDLMPALYIADGHHRSAAASRVSAGRKGRTAIGTDSHDYFLAVAFPHHQMRILDYNRVVKDLAGMGQDEFLARVAKRFDVQQASGQVRPQRPGEFGMRVGPQWYRLGLRAEWVPLTDPVARLDVSLLTDHLLSPVLGIQDLRRDKRIDFVGGIRGLDELDRRVANGEMAAAFSLYPTRMEDLMAVADAGEVMPPKSTWFEPKLADGLISHVLD
jgi:uncharacterized protein (DUF1015 family)